MTQPKSQRYDFRADAEFMRRLDKWRTERVPQLTRAAAVRELCMAGITRDEARKKEPAEQ